MTYEEIIDKCDSIYRQEEKNIYMDGSENYEWKISYAFASRLEAEHGKMLNRIPEGQIRTLFGVPVQIEYLRTNCIELWKRVAF